MSAPDLAKAPASNEQERQAEKQRRPAPLFVRLQRYKLSHAELAVLQCMSTHCPDERFLWSEDAVGSTEGAYACVRRIAEETRISRRTVQYVLHGRPAITAQPADPPKRMKPRSPSPAVPGLIELGILVQMVPANGFAKLSNGKKRRSATYRLKLEALEIDPKFERPSRRTRTEQQQYVPPEVALLRWHEHNPQASDAMLAKIAQTRDARVGLYQTPQMWFQTCLTIAKMYGMPERLARIAFAFITAEPSQEN